MNEQNESNNNERDDRLKAIANLELNGKKVSPPDETVALDGVADGAREAGQVGAPNVAFQGDQSPFFAQDVEAFSAENYTGAVRERSRAAIKVTGITIGVFVAVLLVAYIVGVVSFMGRMLPNTVIEDYDISLKTDDEVVSMLNSLTKDYKIDIKGNEFSYSTTGPDIGLSLDADDIVASVHENQSAWLWPILVFEPRHDESSLLVTTYDEKKANSDAKKAVKKFNKSAKAPVDATVVYDEGENKYTVKPEEEGTQLDQKAVLKTFDEAISQLDASAELSDEHLLKPSVYSDDKKLIDSAEFATGLISAELTLRMNGEDVQTINGDQLSQYVSIDDKYNVKLDEDALNAWVRDLANSFDTIGTQRSYTRADGKQVVVAGGVYGWEVDTAQTKDLVMQAVKAGEKTTIDIPCISTAAVFTGRGERDWGNRYLDVDISEQHVRFYGDDGKVIWETDFISGSPDGEHDTVPGVWTLNNKESPSTLIGYTADGEKEYEEEVQYWMPFEGNGIGFHDATWQPGFGGSMYAEGYGSHGCVNLSFSDAKELYGIIEIGDVVVVHS